MHNDADVLGLGLEVGPEEIGEVGDIISESECCADNGYLAAFLGLRSLRGLQPEPEVAPMPTQAPR